MELFLCWWTMVEADIEASGDDPLPDDAPVLSFSGSGASVQVYVGDIREVVAKLKEV